MIKKKLIILLGLLVISIMVLGCNPESADDQSGGDDSESRGQIIMNPSSSNSSNDAVSDNKDEESNEQNAQDTVVPDDDDVAQADDLAPDSQAETGIFGNLPFTESSRIEYYAAKPSVGDQFSFMQIYGLHIDREKVVAIEDIIFAEVTNAENMSEDKVKDALDDIISQMDEANFKRANGSEIIDAHNRHGDDSAHSFVYYVFDPELAPLESYESFKGYFEEYDFALEKIVGPNEPSQANADTMAHDYDGYNEATLYDTQLYTENAIVTYYIRQVNQDIYKYSYIIGLQTDNGKLVAVEDIIKIELINPEAYTSEEREALIVKKDDETGNQSFNNAKGQETIYAFSGNNDYESVHFRSYVFDPEKAGLADHEAFLMQLINDGFDFMQ